MIVKSSGVGVLDAWLEREVALSRRADTRTLFWDVDAPATLASLAENPDDLLRRHIADYDMVLTYGGGAPVVAAYEALGAALCVPIYNALDPETHYPVPPRREFDGRRWVFSATVCPTAKRGCETSSSRRRGCCPSTVSARRQRLGCAAGCLPNVRIIGHVYTRDHNAFNASALAVLNVCRDSMASNGYSPATRVFEAAGAGACIITDAWNGIEAFLDPGSEVLVANNGAEVAELLQQLSPERARQIGRAARRRVLAEHTYAARARIVEDLLCRDGKALPEAIDARPAVALRGTRA